MEKNYKNFRKKMCLAVAACMLSLMNIWAQAPVTQTFAFTGAVQTFTVPSCVNSITMTASGAQGIGVSNWVPGNGGRASGVISVTSGQVLYIYVGGNNGYNGGGAGVMGANGGGATDVRVGGQNLTDRVLVAGGGGGAGGDNWQCNVGAGHGGGGIAVGANFFGGGGGAGYSNGTGCGGDGGNTGGSGGTGTHGGGGGGGGFTTGGTGASSGAGTAANGALGLGGAAFNSPNCQFQGTGGGGGGYYGGGGAAGNNCGAGRGGGGSSWTGTLTTPSFTAGAQTGNGFFTMTYGFLGNSVGVAASPGTICIGGSATLTANTAVTQTWSPGNATTASIVVSPTTASVYTVQGTNAQGCLSNQTITVVVNTNPTVTAVVSNSNVCAGKSVTMTASGATTYTWTNGVTNAVSYTPAATSGYTVTGTNACGTASAVTSVTVLALPSVSATASSPSVCSGNTVVLSGGGATSYTWNPNVGNNTTFTPQITNNYTVTGLGANGCTNTAVVNVLVINTPTVAPIATPSAICSGTTTTISAVGATTYSWWPAINFLGSGSPSVALSPTISTTYTLVRANGVCTSTAMLNVVVNYPPALVLGPPSTVCACTGSAALSVVGGITYTWQPSGSAAAQLTVFPCSSTIYTVGASNSFCTSYSTIPVATIPLPTITIVASSPSTCAGSTVGLLASGAPTITWVRVTTPPTSTVLPNTAGIIDIPPPNNSLYTATGTGTNGCQNTAQISVVTTGTPPLLVNSSVPYGCNGGTVTLTAFSVPGVTFSWSPTNQTSPSIVVSPTISSTYTAKATYISTGCSTSSVFPLAVFISSFAVNTPSAICRGSSFSLTAIGGATNVLWGITPQTGTMVVVSPTATSVFTVQGINGLCSTIKTITLNVNPLPPVSITTPKWVICLFDNADLTANGAVSYTWTNADGTTDNNTTINFATSGNGGPNGNPTTSTTFTLTGIDTKGCVKTVTATVFVSNCTGIDELNRNTIALDVYPNPNNGEFVVKSDTPLQLSIINELGQKVKELKLTESTTEVNVNGLSNGIYFIIGESNGSRIAKKIVVNK